VGPASGETYSDSRGRFSGLTNARSGGQDAIRSVRRCRPSQVTGHDARLSRGACPEKQRPPVSGRSADRGGDHRGDACRRQQRRRRPAASADRDLVAAGLRIGEALDLAETDLDGSRGAVLVRCGKGGRRREVGTDRWVWSQLEPWIAVRRQLPVGALLCVIVARPSVAAGSHQRPASNLGAPHSRRVCGGGSLPISSVMRMQSRWRMRACRWS